MARQLPIVGEWYQDAEQDTLFEVVAVDDHSGTIELQYEDGGVGEFDFDSWKQMIVLPAEPPEDWRVPYELGSDDSYDPDAVYVPNNYDDPLSSLDSESWYDNDEY